MNPWLFPLKAQSIGFYLYKVFGQHKNRGASSHYIPKRQMRSSCNDYPRNLKTCSAIITSFILIFVQEAVSGQLFLRGFQLNKKTGQLDRLKLRKMRFPFFWNRVRSKVLFFSNFVNSLFFLFFCAPLMKNVTVPFLLAILRCNVLRRENYSVSGLTFFLRNLPNWKEHDHVLSTKTVRLYK